MGHRLPRVKMLEFRARTEEQKKTLAALRYVVGMSENGGLGAGMPKKVFAMLVDMMAPGLQEN